MLKWQYQSCIAKIHFSNFTYFNRDTVSLVTVFLKDVWTNRKCVLLTLKHPYPPDFFQVKLQKFHI